jgi:hypothetical protein
LDKISKNCDLDEKSKKIYLDEKSENLNLDQKKIGGARVGKKCKELGV